MLRKIFLIIIIAITLFFNLNAIKPVFAAGKYGFVPDCASNGNCQLDDFLILAINLIDYMLAISGSLALLFFIYGGFMWLLSAGNSEKVESGKKILSAAAVGLIVVLAGWMIINLVYTTMLATGQPDGIKIEWWKTK